MKVILCDIEGTTTDIQFVKDVLFPYARDNCREFLIQHFEDPEIQEIINDLCKLAESDGSPIERSDDREAFVASIVANVHKQIQEDRKTKELKNLQGKIWKVALENGSIKGHVYEDVARNFDKWTKQGYQVMIYSSGSVEAQKLLFGHTIAGDLLPYLSGHFDTNVGHKQKSQSYSNISEEIQVDAEDILFLSDIPKEVIAAEEAGMKAIILDRPDNPTTLTDEIRQRFEVVKTFDEIQV